MLAVDDKPVNVRFPEEVAPARKMIADLPIGSTVHLLLKRGKETLTLQATTLKLQGAVGEEREWKTWGMSAREVTRAYANEAMLDEARGVVVTTINPGYAASDAELTAGDVILSVDGKDVGDLDDFERLYQQTIDQRQQRVLLEVERDRGHRTVVLKLTYPNPATTTSSTTHP